MKRMILFVLGAALWGGTPQVSAQDSVRAEAVTVAAEDSGYNYNYAEDEHGDEVADDRIVAQDHSSSSGLLQGVKNEDFFENVTNIIVVFIIFTSLTVLGIVILFFRYRNKQAKYKLAAKALENGQPIPEELLGGSRRRVDYEPRERVAYESCSQGFSEPHEQAASEPREQAASAPREQAEARPESKGKDLLRLISYLYRHDVHMRKGVQQLFLGLGVLLFVLVADWPNFFLGCSIVLIFIALGQMVGAYLDSCR